MSDSPVSRSNSTGLKIKNENGLVSSGGISKNPNQVARRNQRERNRVRQVNMGFVTLRNHIPQQNSKSKKLSKVETLRAAAGYIQYLQQLLTTDHSYNGQSMSNLFAQTLQPYSSHDHHHHHNHQTSTTAVAHFTGDSVVSSSNYYNPVYHNYDNQVVEGNYSSNSYKISPVTTVCSDSPQSSFVSDGGYDYVLSPPEVKQYHHNADFTVMHTYS